MATKAVLKEYFETGDLPSQIQMETLIDSVPNFDDDFTPKYVKVSVSSAEILQLNTTPKQLVAAPGAGKVIIPIRAIAYYQYGTSSYLTNLSANLVYGASASEAGSVGNILSGTASQISSFSINEYTASATNSINAALNASIRSGDPTAGDGTLDIHLWYSEVTL